MWLWRVLLFLPPPSPQPLCPVLGCRLMVTQSFRVQTLFDSDCNLNATQLRTERAQKTCTTSPPILMFTHFHCENTAKAARPELEFVVKLKFARNSSASEELEWQKHETNLSSRWELKSNLSFKSNG
ncbi:hypothetical protein B0H13DRAFT_1899267 [Mycena leptocephala]|nr:hypothetical protein B0H13DRAFT_1899267 [Mycena leptocephala]